MRRFLSFLCALSDCSALGSWRQPTPSRERIRILALSEGRHLRALGWNDPVEKGLAGGWPHRRASVVQYEARSQTQKRNRSLETCRCNPYPAEANHPNPRACMLRACGRISWPGLDLTGSNPAFFVWKSLTPSSLSISVGMQGLGRKIIWRANKTCNCQRST